MKPNFFVLREKMARFFQIDVWFATFAHAAKVKCGSVLTPILRAVSVLLTEVLLKNIVGRARPFADESSVFYTYWTDAGSLPAGGYSFPSGHTAAAMAFATALFFSFRKDLSWLFFLLPLAMGFSRVYFQEHYLTDVVASFAVGFFVRPDRRVCRSAFAAPDLLPAVFGRKRPGRTSVQAQAALKF